MKKAKSDGQGNFGAIIGLVMRPPPTVEKRCIVFSGRLSVCLSIVYCPFVNTYKSISRDVIPLRLVERIQ